MLQIYLSKLLNDNTSKEGRIFDFIIQALILISIASFALETLPEQTPLFYSVLDRIEITCVIIFSVEYIARICAAKNPVKYIFSFYGIVDLLAILPFYLNTFIDLRSLRAFRILRVFRALKLIRYNRALNRFNIAAKLVREEIILFLVVILIVFFLVSSGIYYFEREAQPEHFKSVIHSFWWTIVTLTTVGYGDVYPVTVGGKIFTFFVLLGGIGLVTVPTGLIASALSKAREIESQETNTTIKHKERSEKIKQLEESLY